MKTNAFLLTFFLAISTTISTERLLALDSISGNAAYFNPYANPVLAECILGANPVCAEDPDTKEQETFVNECIMMLMCKTKVSDGWCVTQDVPEDPVEPCEQEIPRNGFMNGGTNSGDSACPMCNNNYNPVCGVNGVTYMNYCRLKLCATGVDKANNGPCGTPNFNCEENPKTCPCMYSFSPVCGEDGITYVNGCVTMCAGVHKKSDMACMRPCGCTTIYKPVCSKNMKDFNNECEMECAGEEKLYDGKCPTSTPKNCGHCAGYTNPVCGKNGITYDNECYLKCAKAEKYCDGPCPNKNKCNCDDTFLPVCGIDHKTYRNECLMKCNNVKLKHYKACKEIEVDNSEINGKCGYCKKKPNKLVCGQDQRTYQNPCYLKCLADGKGLHWGNCKPLNPNYCLCPAGGNPCCGSDGKQYANECVLKCMKIGRASPKKCQVRGGFMVGTPF